MYGESLLGPFCPGFAQGFCRALRGRYHRLAHRAGTAQYRDLTEEIVAD